MRQKKLKSRKMMRIKNIVLAVALLAGTVNSLATDKLRVGNVDVAKGNKVVLAIEADFEKDDFIGYQLDVTLPKGLSLELDAGNRPIATSYTALDIVGSVLNTANEYTVYRFVASKMGNPRIPSGNYTLMSATILADAGLTVGEVMACSVSSIKFSDANQQGTNLENVDFNVTITDRIVLDENSTAMPEAATGVNLCVKRTINAGEWSTICLPFSMTTAQVKAAFGDDVELGNFCDTESTYDDADNVVGISMSFEDVDEIEANHPYIIKVSEPVTEFMVDQVDIDLAEDDALVEVDNGLTGRRRVVYGGMYGTYHAQTTLEKYALFLNGNQFWYSRGLTKMKAFRAYFIMLDVLSEAEEAASRISLVFGDDATTAIRDIDGKAAVREVYSLQGVRVKKPGKGLYIRGGKKMIVK